MPNHHDLEPLRRALAERAAELAEQLLGAPSHRARFELRWGRRGSLSLALSGPKRGCWHDFEGGEGGDMLALIRRERRVSFGEAVRIAREMVRQSAHHRPAPAAKSCLELRRDACSEPSLTADLAERVWREAVPARGTLVETYLGARGLRLPEPPDDPEVIRFHPTCPRGVDRLPAMVAVMTTPQGNTPCGVHRTFLRADGTDRLRDERGKAMLGKMGVIRLTPDTELTGGLGLTEGVETGLAVLQRLSWRPVWMATSAGAIAAFPVLPGIEALTVFADADSAGRRAAGTCAQRWAEAGREVAIASPPEGDWADPHRGTA